MSWNYRVVKKRGPGRSSPEVFFQIHEAYYHNRPKNKPPGITLQPITPYGETVAELKETLKMMLKDCEAPVIDHTKKGGITNKERLECAFGDAICAVMWAIEEYQERKKDLKITKKDLKKIEKLKDYFLKKLEC